MASTRERQFARYKALDDVIKLLMRHMASGEGVEFAYYHNKFANEKAVDLYHKELTRIGDQLANRQARLHKELYG